MRKILLSLLILLGILQGLACAEESSITINVYDTCNISGPDVLLGDIADIFGYDNSRIEQLRNLKVANAAAPGEDLVLTSELLGIRLSSAGVDFSGIAWNIPPTIKIKTESQLISGDSLVQIAKNFVYGQIDLSSSERIYTVEASNLPRNCFLPLGDVQYKVDLPYGVRYSAPTNVVVNIYINGAFYTKSMLRLQVTMQEPVVMATRSIAKGEMLTAGDLHLVTVDTSRLPAGYLTNTNDAVGLVARRNINIGVPITKSLLDKEILIKRSDMINLLSKVNGVEIVVPGMAMQNGRVGDRIRVKNTLSNKIVMGRVIDEKTVQVGTH
ncbi:flagellar basal body P-ring formation chaperone FlgA [Anaerosinus gibii]|uniref:Flagellar basal body P-ring formation chaperone FlgA n=1 Tax=Selenobaculum gibii TaxID=3054208 RepID=A0A9Y2EVE3_9FIRM|nr:flagellar basal body P-ring formation chaperone FlgA [Selenobaculum gbiensis]WIW71014.1 flagellar basal body P-ring formation chaperone FlgA [Selenobaculum gbiensis]